MDTREGIRGAVGQITRGVVCLDRGPGGLASLLEGRFNWCPLQPPHSKGPKKLVTDLGDLDVKIGALRSFIWNHLIRRRRKCGFGGQIKIGQITASSCSLVFESWLFMLHYKR